MRRTVITLFSAAALFLATPAVAQAQSATEIVSSETAGAGMVEGSSAYVDGLSEVVGSSDSPVLNTALTLLADWAVGAVLISVVGGLVATFL